MASIKAVLVGDSSVGKTAMFSRLDSDSFQDKANPTVGGAFTNITVNSTSGNEHVIGFWDTAGQEKFRNIVPMYFQNSNFIIIVYDITSDTSFKNVEHWAQMARDSGPRDAALVLIGNKSDLEKERVIGFGDAIELSQKIGAKIVFEVSAKSGTGFDLLIGSIADYCDELEKPNIAIEQHISGNSLAKDDGCDHSNDSKKKVDGKKCNC